MSPDPTSKARCALIVALFAAGCTTPPAQTGGAAKGGGAPKTTTGASSTRGGGEPDDSPELAEVEPMAGAPDEERALTRRTHEMEAPEGADPSAAALFDALRQGRRHMIAAKASEELRLRLRAPDFDAVAYLVLGMGELVVGEAKREKLDSGGTRSVYPFGPPEDPERYTLELLVDGGLLTDFRIEGGDLTAQLSGLRGSAVPLQFLDLYRTDAEGRVIGRGATAIAGERVAFQYHVGGLKPGEDGKAHYLLSVILTNHGTGDRGVLTREKARVAEELEPLAQARASVGLTIPDPGTYTIDLLVESEDRSESVALSEPFLVVPAQPAAP